jgi:hypothetical protein
MISAEEYCLARSQRLRLRADDSRWLVGLAVTQLPPRPPRIVNLTDQTALGHRLCESLTDSVRHRYGNPLLVWFLVQVVVPVVVRLVVQWWLNRQEA